MTTLEFLCTVTKVRIDGELLRLSGDKACWSCVTLKQPCRKLLLNSSTRDEHAAQNQIVQQVIKIHPNQESRKSIGIMKQHFTLPPLPRPPSAPSSMAASAPSPSTTTPAASSPSPASPAPDPLRPVTYAPPVSVGIIIISKHDRRFDTQHRRTFSNSASSSSFFSFFAALLAFACFTIATKRSYTTGSCNLS